MAMSVSEMRDRIRARMPGAEGEEIIKCLESQSASIDALVTWGTTLAAKLNADAGVTDTNYAPPAI